MYEGSKLSLGVMEKNKMIQKKSRRKSSTTGRWTTQEEQIYLDFLLHNKALFQKTQNKRTTRVFKRLADAVPGRNPEQCRSHHLKLLRTCKCKYDEIIRYVQKKLQMGSEEEAEIKDMPDNGETDYRRTDFIVYNKEVMRKGQGRGIKSQRFVQVEINIDAIEPW